ncbi:hypothetical protein GCM10022237_25640 [Nocardioides ginsengisoli]|uniref:Creatininase family protein n=1 Tax=Nocardioides ginsengisoli TaxID=363868 RepID=A0ABW3W7U4_9ACTN
MTVILPVGTLSCHGAHLPLGTDTDIAVAVSESAAMMLRRRGIDVVVAPAVPYGAGSPVDARGNVGTAAVEGSVLHAYLIDLARSFAAWAGQVVVVSRHGAPAGFAVAGLDVAWVDCDCDAVGVPAPRGTTSLMLHLKPWEVRLPRAVVAEVRASADEGRELLDSLAWVVARDVLRHRGIPVQ